MKNVVTFVIFHLLLFQGFSQKTTISRYDAQEIKTLHVVTDEVIKINLKTTRDNVIVVKSKSTGEYYNDIALYVEVQQDNMILTSLFKENLQSGYDKLSAHKVFSMEITLEVPEDLEVFVKSNSASLSGTGNFKYLEVELTSGDCRLFNFRGNALVNTYKGAISLQTKNAVITASSRNGHVILPVLTKGIHNIELHTINGDILVQEN